MDLNAIKIKYLWALEREGIALKVVNIIYLQEIFAKNECINNIINNILGEYKKEFS